MQELQYLADHLHPNECRRLVAALHFKQYDQPRALDTAEAKVSEDIPCLNLLLHWNSAQGEGLGETHELLFRRLHQIGRDDLAEWLGNTVFSDLGDDLKRSLKDPFQEFSRNTTESTELITTHRSTSTKEDPNAWIPFDTICWTVIIFLCLTTILLLSQSIYAHCTRKEVRGKKRRKQSEYRRVDQQLISDTESEDKLDDRNNDPASKLLGV